MKKTYLKLLLTAVGLLVGSGAWAQTTTTLLEYGTADNAWDADALGEWTAGGGPAIKTDYVEISGGNGSYETSKAISPTEDAVINVQAVWRAASATGRAFEKGNGSYFRFGNIIVAQNDQDKKHGYGFAGLANMASVTTFSAGSYRTDIENCTWLLIEMEISTSSNKVTSFSVKSEDGNTTYASASGVVLQDADYTTVAFGYKKSSSVSTTNKEDLKWVKITQTVKPVTTANYTVKYVCGDTEVKESVSRKGEVDQAITLSSTDTENFYTESQKYIYVSSDVEGKKVAEGVVVTVKFREAEKYAWTAKSSVGSYTISCETWEGDKASVKYPLYQLVGKDLWTKGAINMTFAQDFDVTENNQELSLDYTETEITDVVFYSEGEDIEGASVINTGNAAARSSQRAAGYSASGNLLITSLPLGKFKVYARFYSPTSAGGKYNFFAGARNIWAVETGNSNATDLNTEVVLAQTDNPIALGQTGYTQGLDFIYIQYLGEPTAEELIAAALSEAKAQLSDIIAAATSLNEKYLNNSDMTDAITAAQYIVDDPTATLDNVEDAIASMQTIAETAFPEVMAKVEKFLAENPGITVEGIDELEAAVAAKDLVAIGAAADKAYTSFSNAAAAFVQSATDLAAAGEAASAEGVTDLQTAIAAATAVLTADGKTIEDKAKALVALNEALNAYKIANGSDLLKEAVALAADEDAVAVGKLKQAIAVALAGDETKLQTAVDQFKADNAPLETDLTSKFSALTDPANWVNANGAWSVAYAGWAAPQVTVDGKSVALVESYRDGQEFKLSTGDVMYQDITGLTPGTYAIELYGAACLTPGRNGMTTDFAEGDENSQKGAYLYAKVGDNIFKEYVPCLIEDNMNNRGGEEAIPTAKLSGVVVGEEGTIRVGLAKELGLTNWHFVQLKKVIAQVLAKDLFATDLAKMNATIAEAEALNSKEHLTEGKEALANAIEAAKDVVANKQMYNIDEMQAAVTALENAIAAFKLANYVAYEGVAYVQSVATGKYMAAGHDYGTHGIVNETGLDLTFAANAETKKVTIDSQVSNGGDSHFLGSNLYMDSGAFEWIIEKFGENYSISNGEKYLGVDEKDNLALVDDAYAWAIVPDTDVKAARMATLEGATEIDPADATWMMSNPNFNRNDQRVSAWAVSEDCTNKNLNGGNQVNNCAESFHSTFTISQAITGAPAGLYKLTAQGFYRQDDDVTEDAPVFFIGDETAELPAKTGSEGGMGDASASFADGKYTIAPIEFFYDGENTLTVGVKGTAVHQWVIFDNFQLSYLGMPSAVVAEAIDDDYFTFSSKYPVDLDNLPEGLKAYYVNNVEGDKAYVEEASGAVAAGTGLLLKAETADEYEIPVVATSSKLDGNLLVGVQEKDVVASDATGAPVIQGAGYYVLIYDGNKVVFSQVNGEASVDLSKLVGKAYLYYAGSNAGKLRIAFPGEATAINSLDAEAQKSGKGIYNLSGQKVNAGYKGIVIVNGKKVMMK